MVSMAEEGRDVLRFLWVDDILVEQSRILEFRSTRVMFGVSPTLSSSMPPYGTTLSITSSLSQPLKKLCKSFYVDDLITGAEDEEQVYQLFMHSKMMLKDGGFNLRKFTSNSPSLQTRVDLDETDALTHPLVLTLESEETYSSSTLGPGQEMQMVEQKVLGVRWNVSQIRLWST